MNTTSLNKTVIKASKQLKLRTIHRAHKPILLCNTCHVVKLYAASSASLGECIYCRMRKGLGV